MTEISAPETPTDSLFEVIVEELVALRPASFVAGEITPTTRLYSLSSDDGPSLELDSLDALELISALEERLGIEIDTELDLEGIRTVNDVTAIVRRSS